VNSDAGLAGRADHAVRVGQRKRDRLLDQDLLAELDRVQQRLDVRPLAGGDDDGVDLGPRDDRRVVAGVELRAGLLREVTRLGRLRIGNRQETDRGMLRRQARAQRADAAGTDNRDTQFFSLDGRLLERAAILAGDTVMTDD
jgi:hypothetical protein